MFGTSGGSIPPQGSTLKSEDMFLDDELYSIAIKKGNKPKHWQDKSDIINQMLIAIENYLNNQTEKDKTITYHNLMITRKRAMNHWDNTINKLKKEGYDFINPEGLFLIPTIEGNKVDIEIKYIP